MISGGSFGSFLSNVTGGILGSGPSSYVDPHLKEENEALYQGVKQRNKLGNNPLTGKLGLQEALQGFNLKPMTQATTDLGQASKFEKYKPYQFNFSHLPGTYEQQVYNRAAGDVRRENAGSLATLRNTVGNRRTGLLAKLGEDQQRSLMETLGKTRTDLGIERMKQDVDLGKAQQVEQASENRQTMSGQAAERRARLGAEADVGAKTAGLQSDLLERERTYRDQGLGYLQDLYNSATGQAQNRVANANARRGATISGVASAASLAAGG